MKRHACKLKKHDSKNEKTKTCKSREIQAHVFLPPKTISREISANKNQIVLTEKGQESKVMKFKKHRFFSRFHHS